MRTLESILKKLEGYLLSIKRNTISGKYELEVGIPKDWICKATDKIEIEIIHETEKASLIKIFSDDEEIEIDDLIDFVNLIIETNEKISKMQEEFERQMEETKQDLAKKVEKFYDKLDEVKENSFNSLKEKFEEEKDKKRKNDNLDQKNDLEESLENNLSTK